MGVVEGEVKEYATVAVHIDSWQNPVFRSYIDNLASADGMGVVVEEGVEVVAEEVEVAEVVAEEVEVAEEEVVA